jgi:hypothetical protein
MKSMLWPVRYGFAYPENCTVGMLQDLLAELALRWVGWIGFPWRVTRNMQRYLGRPPVNFHYLMVQRCLACYAAHLVLTEKFVDRQAVLAMLIRENFEMTGVVRALLVEGLRFEMRMTRQPYVMDCSGPEDGHCNVPAEEIELRRTAFRDNVEELAQEFAALLNLASQTDDMAERMLGHSIRFWALGADMPADEMLEVQAEESAEGVVLIPGHREVLAFMTARKPVPRLLVKRSEYEEVLKCGSSKVRECGGVAAGGERETVGSGRIAGDGPPHPVAPGAVDGAAGAGGATGTAEEQQGEPAAMELNGVSGRMQKKRVIAGRKNAVVKDRGDRRLVREEVKRIMGLGLSQTEACRQVAEQMRQGRVGAHKLTMKYDLASFEATVTVVRRVYQADW